MTYTPISSTALANPQARLAHIQQARRAVLYGEAGHGAPSAGLESWIENSWRRCLASGQQPEQRLVFGSVADAALRRTLDANHLLVQSAKPVLEKVGRAIANTRYFAILTNQHGIVVDAGGAIDRSDRRADLITRIGTDLSESQLATTAIGAALNELQPVWLHRGEHFFEANAAYSCAGAPLFGPDGDCVGMLDLTGIETAERPELKHLVSQAARSIENALTLGRLGGQQHSGMLVRLNWPGRALGDETDGLVCVDDHGFVLGANQTARQMLPQINQTGQGTKSPQHCSELFAMAFEMLFDAARQRGGTRSQSLEVPLWSGLRLQALAQKPGQNPPGASPKNPPAQPVPDQPGASLKEVETALIHQAVDDAKGNVMQAARALGISRATVYRRLGAGKR